MFLDGCLHMFFSQFVPSFPVVHPPTFVFKDWTHPLLLNAIALGSLFAGKKDYVRKVWLQNHCRVSKLTSEGRSSMAAGAYSCCNFGSLLDSVVWPGLILPVAYSHKASWPIRQMLWNTIGPYSTPRTSICNVITSESGDNP